MNRRILLLLLVPAAVLAWWAVRSKTQPPQISFARARRETLVSNLITNGKVEPVRWQEIRADTRGLIVSVPVKESQTVAKGALLAQLSEPGLAEDVRAAEARDAQARAGLQTLNQGGRRADITQIENDFDRIRANRDQAQREFKSLSRLRDKQAATTVEVEAAHDKLREAELALAAIEKRRKSLISEQDVAASRARVEETASGVRQMRERLAQGAVRAPIAGTIYSLPARPGTYVNPGDLVASIGNLDRLRVRVYVDEPELGRVQTGQPVKISWDGLPGRSWTGEVEKKPAEIVTLGTRQVGEVQVTIDNPNHDLVPGTNVNAEIRTNVAANALTVPKESMHRESGVVGVYLLAGDHVVWRPVKVGAASVTRAQILEGLQDNDAVALPSDHGLKDGDPVRPVIQ